VIKKIIGKFISAIRNIGVIIFAFLGFSFTKTENKKNEKIEENDESGEGTAKTVILPIDKEETKEEMSFSLHKKINEIGSNNILKQKCNELEYDYLGITIYNDENLNIIISEVEKNSIADKLGLKEGDILSKINDVKASEQKTYDFISQIQKFENKNTKIIYIRDKKELEVDIVFEKKIDNEVNLEEIPVVLEKTEHQTLTENDIFIKETINDLETKKIFEEEVFSSEIYDHISETKDETNITPLVEPVVIATITGKLVEEKPKELAENKVKKKHEKSKKNLTKDKNKKKIENDVEIDPKEKEVLLIKNIIDEDKKEKELKIALSKFKKKTLLDLLKIDNRFKMQYLPFLIFKRRMVRNMYKAHLLSNSLVSARRLLGENIEYRNVNCKDLLFKRKTTSNFIDLTYDNLYNIDMLKIELRKEYGSSLEVDPTLIEVMDRINYLEERTIARYQRLIEHKKELEKKQIKRKILVKK